MDLGYLLPPAIAGILGLVLSFLVVRSNFWDTTHRLFAASLLSIASWAFVIFAMRASPDLEHALPWDRAVIPLAGAGAVFYLHFTVRYTEIEFPRKFLLLAYLYVTLLAFLSPTDLLIPRMQLKPYGYAPVPGPLFFPAIMMQYSLLSLAGINLLRGYKKATAYEEKNRITYLLIALLSFLLLSLFDILPLLGLPLYPGAIIGNIVFCSLTALCILKYNLLDVRIAVRKGMAYAVMSAAVALVYVGAIFLFTQVFGGQELSSWLYVVLLLLLAFLLQPLWLRVQHLVDRWFYRDRYNYLKALETFSWQSQSLTDSTGLGSTMVNLIAKALRTPVVCLLLPQSQNGDFASACWAGMKDAEPEILLRSRSPLLNWLRHSGGILSGRDLDIIPQLQSIAPKEREALKQMGTELVVPLKTRPGQLSGVLLLGRKLSEQPYTIEEKQLIHALSSQMAVKLENARMYNDALQSRQNLEIWLNGMSDCVMIIDKNCTVQFINRAGMERFGGRAGKGHCWDMLGKDSMCPHCIIQSSFGINREALQYTTKIGNREYDVAAAPLLNPDGSLSVIEVMRDVTERMRAEEALRKSEEQLRAIFEAVENVSFIITDTQHPELLVLEFSPGAEKIFGHTRKEIIGKPVSMLRLPEDVAKITEDHQQKSKRGFMRETTLVRKSGEEFPALFSTYPLLDKKDRMYATLIVTIDISERKNLEARLQRAQKMEAVGTLAGGVAHDLNNILAGIVSYPDLLLMQIPEDSPLRKPILTMQKSGNKAVAIVQDLLTLARRGVTTREVLNLNDIISEYLKSPEYEKLKSYHPGVEVETNLEADLLNITGSPVHLTKTVMNLVSNAAEAMPQGGKILIYTENRYIDRPINGYDSVKEGDYITLTVSDTGTGISSEDIERIFEPFYTKKVMGRSGTGLGMAVVWGTVKDHNGYIDVQSKEGKGTTFRLYFPATRQELTKDKPLLPFEDYAGKGESILVVDDVKEQREIALGMLNTLGYKAHAVSSGEEAVEYIKEHAVDLIVLDMIMDPGMDGLDTYRKVLELRPGQKVIIVSGFSETGRVKEAQRLGAGTYVKKPYTLEKIAMAVKAELER